MTVSRDSQLLSKKGVVTMKGNNTNNTVLSNPDFIEEIEARWDLTFAEVIEMYFRDDEWDIDDICKFVSDSIKFDVPLADILWFAEWEPDMLRLIERAYQPYGYFEIFEDWDAYLAEEFDYFDNDPHQPLDAMVTVDAGLSGVWYVQTC